MFLIFGTTQGKKSFGFRFCRYLACCAQGGNMEVFCTYTAFTLFFLPLFRYGKRYFAACPQCGVVYEMSVEEGKRLSRDPSAQIDPNNLFIVQDSYKKTCPSCKSSVNGDCLYCPYCGARLR